MKALKPAMDRIQMMIGRAVIMAVDDSLRAQGLKVELLDGEIHDEIEHYQQYGFSSVPLAGAEAVIAFIGGLRSHGICIGTVDRSVRLTNLAPGECAIHDDQGQKVHITRDGIVIETDKPLTVNAKSAVVTIEDDATVTATNVKLIADRVDLGDEGGAKVARVGDHVVGGVITEGSAKVFAA